MALCVSVYEVPNHIWLVKMGSHLIFVSLLFFLSFCQRSAYSWLLNDHVIIKILTLRLHAFLVQWSSRDTLHGTFHLVCMWYCVRSCLNDLLFNLRFIIVKLAEVRKEVQCPICLGMSYVFLISVFQIYVRNYVLQHKAAVFSPLLRFSCELRYLKWSKLVSSWVTLILCISLSLRSQTNGCVWVLIGHVWSIEHFFSKLFFQ